VEALVASELADFTIFDSKLCRDLDPRLPTQHETIELATNLHELTRDIERSLQTKLKPIYHDLFKNQSEGDIDQTEKL